MCRHLRKSYYFLYRHTIAYLRRRQREAIKYYSAIIITSFAMAYSFIVIFALILS